jgi:hypothetical protein
MITPTFSDDPAADLISATTWLDFFAARGTYSAEIRKHLDDAVNSVNSARQAIDDLPKPSTVDFEVMCWQHVGFTSGAAWSMSQTRTPNGYRHFVSWWLLNMKLDKRLGADALVEAAQVLLMQPGLSAQQALDWWNAASSMLPPNDPAAMGEFIDGFRWGARSGFEKVQDHRREAATKQRLSR